MRVYHNPKMVSLCSTSFPNQTWLLNSFSCCDGLWHKPIQAITMYKSSKCPLSFRTGQHPPQARTWTKTPQFPSNLFELYIPFLSFSQRTIRTLQLKTYMFEFYIWFEFYIPMEKIKGCCSKNDNQKPVGCLSRCPQTSLWTPPWLPPCAMLEKCGPRFGEGKVSNEQNPGLY